MGKGGLRLTPPSSDAWHTVSGLIEATTSTLTLAISVEKGRSAYIGNVSVVTYTTQPVGK
jgi:hypothetical protein